MKKLIAIGIAVCVMLFVGTLSHADTITTQKDVVVHLPVDSQFGMEIYDTEFDQMLSDVLPGGGATGDIHIYATSNHSIPWFVNASSDGLTGEFEAAPDTLPVVISTYGGALTGTIVTDLTLSGTAVAIYSAGAGEYPCSGLEVGSIFSVTSEVTTKQDLYTGTIVLTITE